MLVHLVAAVIASSITLQPLRASFPHRVHPPRLAASPPPTAEPRANNVALAPLSYSLVLPLQAVALSDAPWAHLIFFCVFGTLTVQLAATAKPIRERNVQRLSMQQAVLAPIAASALLLLLYVLIVYLEFDPSSVYRLSVSGLAVVAVRDIVMQAVAASRQSSGKLGAASNSLPSLFTQADGAIALVLGLILVGDYAIRASFSSGLLSGWQLIEQNLIAWALAMFSIAIVSLRTFTTAVIFLSGLFVYDVFWVFSTDVMMTVATKIDAPVKLLAFNSPASAAPYAVLGLGDIAIPAFFCALMHQFDETLSSETPDAEATPYRRNSVIAYPVGLAVAFWANEVVKRGQPALLYLVPAVVGSAVLTAWSRGELEKLLRFEAAVTQDRIPLDLAMLSEEQRNSLL
mmetsp:Transcript_42430/g.70562  ORF Transcript_42430/g.70562 Transcript_42430/m.70562 type:complete len:402 (+) Transcript_42430:80-1285(+)